MMVKKFDGKKAAKLSTEKNPAVVNVQTEERLKEVAAIFEEKDWKYTVELEADKPEDIFDLERLLNPPKPKKAGRKKGTKKEGDVGSKTTWVSVK